MKDSFEKELTDLFKEVRSLGAVISDSNQETFVISKGDETFLSIDARDGMFDVAFDGTTRRFSEMELMDIADVLKDLVLTKLDGVDRGMSEFAW